MPERKPPDRPAPPDASEAPRRSKPPVPLAPVPEKIGEPPGNLAARERAYAKRRGRSVK